MIELAFGEGPAAVLKMAISIMQGNHSSSIISVIGSMRNEQHNTTFKGSPEDVAALTLALDIGDISDMDVGMNQRKKLLDVLFEGFPDVSDTIWGTNQHSLSWLQEAKTTLEPVRMWISSNDPAELCGFYFICHLMVDALTPLSIVRIPMQIERDNSIVTYRSTGEISPEEFCAFARYEEAVSDLQRRVNSDLWNELVHGNSPLRAIVNGSLVSVSNDFYDFALRANIPNGNFETVILIGKTLMQIPGVGDRWLFLRIQNMLQSGELISISAATRDHPYSEVVRRNDHAKR